MKTFFMVTAFTLFLVLGYISGMHQNVYDRGFKKGQQEALSTVNDMLAQRGYKFWFKYTDTVYELVIPQGSMKANVRGKNRITTTEQ